MTSKVASVKADTATYSTLLSTGYSENRLWHEPMCNLSTELTDHNHTVISKVIKIIIISMGFTCV